MFRLYVQGNYFFLQIGTDRAEEYNRSEILIHKVSDTDYKIVNGGRLIYPRNIPFSKIRMQDGNPYSSQTAFETWYRTNTGFNIPQEGGKLNGFIDYNDTTGSFSISANTWTDIPNNGLGAFTNKNYPPTGVTELMDTSTGYIDTTELELGDGIFIRNDFTINPNTNNAQLLLRYELGYGEGLYTLEKIVGRLDSGSGQNYRFSLTPDFIYIGDDNTRLNPIKFQVNCTSNATFTNAGSVITVLKR